MTKLGKRPGDPWECGRCASEGGRAVLAVDRRPGCHVCRDVDGMPLFNLILVNCYSNPAIKAAFECETPFKRRLNEQPYGKPLATRQWQVWLP